MSELADPDFDASNSYVLRRVNLRRLRKPRDSRICRKNKNTEP